MYMDKEQKNRFNF